MSWDSLEHMHDTRFCVGASRRAFVPQQDLQILRPTYTIILSPQLEIAVGKRQRCELKTNHAATARNNMRDLDNVLIYYCCSVSLSLSLSTRPRGDPLSLHCYSILVRYSPLPVNWRCLRLGCLSDVQSPYLSLHLFNSFFYIHILISLTFLSFIPSRRRLICIYS